MDHHDHVHLLREGVPGRAGVWADLGCGRGAFTLALAELIGPGGAIYAVDRDRGLLRNLRVRMQREFPQVGLHLLAADFNQRLELPPLDGIVMANSLHFQQNPLPTLRLARAYLKPSAPLLLVEYNIEHGNAAVPYPVAFKAWTVLASQAGFVGTRLLVTRPSSTMGQIYSACSWNSAVRQNGVARAV
jgi:ubiquinone/menaquinone biosynthesis C-methylase UbiE